MKFQGRVERRGFFRAKKIAPKPRRENFIREFANESSSFSFDVPKFFGTGVQTNIVARGLSICQPAAFKPSIEIASRGAAFFVQKNCPEAEAKKFLFESPLNKSSNFFHGVGGLHESHPHEAFAARSKCIAGSYEYI